MLSSDITTLSTQPHRSGRRVNEWYSLRVRREVHGGGECRGRSLAACSDLGFAQGAPLQSIDCGSDFSSLFIGADTATHRFDLRRVTGDASSMPLGNGRLEGSQRPIGIKPRHSIRIRHESFECLHGTRGIGERTGKVVTLSPAGLKQVPRFGVPRLRFAPQRLLTRLNMLTGCYSSYSC